MPKKDYGGWENLWCDYFSKPCLDILGAHFASIGFACEATEIGGMVFRRGSLFVEISYEPESSPEYFMKILLGTGDARFDADGAYTSVPAWFISKSAEVPNKDYRFKGEGGLREVLESIRQDFATGYLAKFVEDAALLQSEIDAFKVSVPDEK